MASTGYDLERYMHRPSEFGAIGEEVKAARLADDLYNLNFEGGVLLESPSTNSDGTTGSLRELVATSEPLFKESPRAARLLSADKTELCIPYGLMFGSPNYSESVWSAADHYNYTISLQSYGQRDCSTASRTIYGDGDCSNDSRMTYGDGDCSTASRKTYGDGDFSTASRMTYSDVNSSAASRQTRSETYSSPTPRKAQTYTFVAHTPQHRRISILAREDHGEVDGSPTPRRINKAVASTPQHRRMSLAELKQSPPGVQAKEDDFEIFLPPSQIASILSSEQKSRSRKNTVSVSVSSTRKRFDDMTYPEIFESVNSKLESTLRKLVLIRPGEDPKEKQAFSSLTAYHVNFDRINLKLAEDIMIQPALVHGLIWRLFHDLIFTTPVLDCAPSPHAQAFKEAWLNDVGCCTPAQRSSDWTNVKGPLMRARVAAVHEVIRTTPNFRDWIQQFSIDLTTKIVERLDLVWRHGAKAQAIYELTNPITKLVRVAIRMRSDLRHFDFCFLEYGAKARSDKYIHHNVNPNLLPAPENEDVDHHVVLTRNPEISEKDYEKIQKVTIFKAEVVVSQNFANNAHLLEKNRGRKVQGIQGLHTRNHRTPRRRLHYK